ncbi:PLP-dependent aminotransferase family protein [Marinobacterium mangrovicola]|uniref:GntR family transcriptional regulator n=1 Tax=Marinobacterium mangrovicola TaxID=1476959 RepID=A0A4R1GJ47_9GAMM|nr:PLP-dependent aminotransferase family protein [Marinobacterium mangrovicola]TCK08284.1 GntR family transcriptional regulator [Marinobacterium mangrovicola]
MDESGLARTDLGLFLELNRQDPALPAYRRLFLALRRLILERRVGGGTRLPATRSLAAALNISRNTVKSAYELLQAEGYIYTRTGAGCFVAELPQTPQGPKSSGQAPDLSTPAKNAAGSSGAGLLQPAVPALDHFPYRRWQRAMQKSVSAAGLLAGDPQGDLKLRREIVRWLGAQRGMQVDADQVLITSGSQQGIYLVANQLVSAGDKVLLERPGFPGSERVFKAAGAKIDYFHQQDLDEVESLGEARLMLLTPSRNFPLGHTLPADRRLALLDWAQRNDVWLLEDDYDSEFAAGPALSAMFSLDIHQRVIYAGTFSRTLFPGLRLGYLVLPRSLLTDFLNARRVIDGGLSMPAQLALAEFMACGDYGRHLRRMKRFYLQRRQMLEAQIAESALAGLPVIDAGGGMNLCLKLPSRVGESKVDDQAVVALLTAEGVSARALSLFDPEEGCGLVLGFAAQDRDAMRRGVAILERVLQPIISAAE